MASRNARPAVNGPEDFILGVDLDGVCADFYAGLRPIAAEWMDVPEKDLAREVSFGLDEWNLKDMGGYEALHRFAVTQRDLFLNLLPMPGVRPALRRLSSRGVRIRIITHRLYLSYIHSQTIAQTVAWLERHGLPYWDLCFLKDKTAVGADLYIEDSPANVQSLRAQGNRVIVFGNSTNRHLPGPRAESWRDIEKLVLAEFNVRRQSRSKPRR